MTKFGNLWYRLTMARHQETLSLTLDRGRDFRQVSLNQLPTLTQHELHTRMLDDL